jgi:hypothetical protein
MSLGTVRTDIAAAASTVVGLDVRSWPIVKAPVTGDGWVVVQRITPAAFRTSAVTFAVVVCLGADTAKAEELFEAWGIPVLDAVTQAIPCADVAVEPVALATEQAGTLHGFTLTLTTEV